MSFLQCFLTFFKCFCPQFRLGVDRRRDVAAAAVLRPGPYAYQNDATRLSVLLLTTLLPQGVFHACSPATTLWHTSFRPHSPPAPYPLSHVLSLPHAPFSLSFVHCPLVFVLCSLSFALRAFAFHPLPYALLPFTLCPMSFNLCPLPDLGLIVFCLALFLSFVLLLELSRHSFFAVSPFCSAPLASRFPF